MIMFGCSSRGEREESINVMTYNIRYDDNREDENAWENRKKIISETIQFHKVGIAGLQEALKHQIDDLKKLLHGYEWFGVGREDGIEKGEFNPIFFLEDKYQILEKSTFWLSETPGKPGIIAWDAACPRIVTWGKFKDKRTGIIFYIFNTHFDHIGETARVKSAELLVEKIEEVAGEFPVILTGDFNCTVNSRPYEILYSGRGDISGVINTQMLSGSDHYGSTGTYNRFSHDLRPGHAIDFIFVRNIREVLRHGVFSNRWDGEFGSDHWPVLTEIIIH